MNYVFQTLRKTLVTAAMGTIAFSTAACAQDDHYAGPVEPALPKSDVLIGTLGHSW